MRNPFKSILLSVSILLAAVFLITAVVFFIPRDNTSFSFECFQVRAAVSGFLKDLKKERYDDAFDSVYCFSAEDGSAVFSESCRDVWTKRVEGLRSGEESTYLSDFSDLRVRKVDGNFQVTVLLFVQRQGYNDPFYSNGNVITVIYEDGWKISSVSGEPVGLQTPFEKAVSGCMTESDWAGKAG